MEVRDACPGCGAIVLVGGGDDRPPSGALLPVLPERSYRYFDPVGDDAAPRLGIREWKAGGVRILEVRVQEIVPGSKRYFCVDTRKASFYLDGGRDTALYAIFDGETPRWLVRADVVVNDPPNMAEPMQFRLVGYLIDDPKPVKTAITRHTYDGDVGEHPERTLEKGLPQEIAMRLEVDPGAVRFISGF